MASANYSTSTYAASATGAQAPIQIDWRDDVPSTIAYQVIYNVGASGSVGLQYTLDNAADPNVTPVWTTLGSAIAATGYGVIGFPVQFIRLNIGSLSGGTLTFNVLQGSVLGDGTSGAAGGGPTSSVTIAGPLGQKAMAASIPVTIASDQTTLPVGGNIASGAADSGNPVKVGGVYNSTLPTLTTGQRGDAQFDTRGALYTTPKVANGTATPSFLAFSTDGLAAASQAGFFNTNANYLLNGTTIERQVAVRGVTSTGVGVTAVESAGSSFTNITTNTTTAAIKTGTGTLHKIIINNPGTTEVITVYDSLTATGTKIATISAGTAPSSLWYDAFFSTGLTVVTSGTTAGDYTVIWR